MDDFRTGFDPREFVGCQLHGIGPRRDWTRRNRRALALKLGQHLGIRPKPLDFVKLGEHIVRRHLTGETDRFCTGLVWDFPANEFVCG